MMSDCKCCDTTEHCYNGCYHRMLFVNHHTTYIFILYTYCRAAYQDNCCHSCQYAHKQYQNNKRTAFFLCSLLSLLCPFILLLIFLSLFKPNFSYSYYTPCFCKLQDIIKFFLFFPFLTKLFLQTIAVFIALC